MSLISVVCGCDLRIEHFQVNEVYALTIGESRGVDASAASQDVTTIVESLFGSPEKPIWPSDLLTDPLAKKLVSNARIRRAAGPVFSDREGNNFGLFNKHCVNCHGVSGSGTGPASVFQDPYPRDFRVGIFKWKHTQRRAKPTRDGVATTIHAGVRGTAMPSFSNLSELEWSCLTDYVIFLSVRGETERNLLAACVDDLGYDGAEASPRLSESDQLVAETLQSVVDSWIQANSHVVSVPDETDNDVASVERGKSIFHGQIANCVGCHGTAGNGNVVMMDYDDWAKEYSSRIGLTPTDREAMEPFRDAGAHRPRKIKPRRLDDGVFRGGSDSVTLYRRISEGIAGTPMPSIQISEQESTTGLSVKQTWDLVHYVQSLGHLGQTSEQAKQE